MSAQANLAKYLLHAVEVKWIDSATDVGWKADINCDPVRITSIGILARFNQQAITITHSISEFGRVCDSITIPRGCIQNIKRLSDQKAVDFEVKITQGTQHKIPNVPTNKNSTNRRG